jgi:hypothetical protein
MSFPKVSRVKKVVPTPGVSLESHSHGADTK